MGSGLGLSFFLVLVWAPWHGQGLVHHLNIRDDSRGSFFIESFGFEEGGLLHLNLTEVHVGDPHRSAMSPTHPF
jgi:hypothetical protein